MSILDRMYEAFKRLDCIAVCETCVRKGEEVRSRSFFGDFSLCERCNRSVTSRDEAFWVRA